MPGLLRGIVRTAAISGTATAVSNRVSRRQAERWASEGEPPQQQQGPPPTGAGSSDMITQLKELGQLHEQGVLTDDEFASQKARLLN